MRSSGSVPPRRNAVGRVGLHVFEKCRLARRALPDDLQDLSALIPGTYAALNVPDGEVTVGGTYNSMTFPEHTAKVFKKPDGATAEGTITSTAVVPGPF